MKSFTSLQAIALLGAGMILAPQTAFAQDNGEAAAEEFDDGIIIVTAQGREQSLADVPVAISAVSGEMLEKSGVTDIRELNQVAPSLLVSSTGNEANGSARIRGIGTVGDNPGLESSVAVFVDGVYRSRSGNALSEIGPIDRIEILRGPQGTLGGRNSSAGMISIYTAQPEFELSGYGAFTYGNYDAIRVEGGINAPLGDSVAARIDGVSGWAILTRITLPLLKPTIVFLVVFSSIGFLRIFDQVYNMTTNDPGGPLNSTKPLVLMIYQTAFSSFDMGYAAAQTVVLFLVLLIVSLIQLRILRDR